MALSDQQLLHCFSRMPFVDTAELAGFLGDPPATIHPTLTSLLTNGGVGRVSHVTADLPSNQRYYLTANGIGEAAGFLGFPTSSDFVRAYPVSREWLALLILDRMYSKVGQASMPPERLLNGIVAHLALLGTERGLS